jgi:hypothetical protein
MTANLTRYAQKKLIDHTLGLANYPMPTAFMGLFKSNPGEDGVLTDEATGGSYARVALSGLLTATVLSTGLAVNASTITFPSPSATWGAITHAAILDASTGGNALLWLVLQPGLMIASGVPAPNLPPGYLQITGLFTSTSQITQYLAKKWLDHLLGIAAFTMPTTAHLGLFSDDPTETGSLTNEIATGSYARQNITPSMGPATLSTGIAVSTSTIEFPPPTGAYVVTHYGVLDAPTSGNMLWRKGRVSTLDVISGGPPVRISGGQLALQAS